ncbi:MAG TPA: SufS family cysteine desulfurase [Bacteroidia bacterium]|jgi:cysteine desulfurase/selenocysteine lyase|nr:SufS family cysteine desulfurase [Bacteroidia bacterium]
MFDVKKIRNDFPILSRTINGKPLIYFDNGATTQKPNAVIGTIVKYYSEQNANIHRGVHTLSREATILFEEARKTVAQFINASEEEVIFTAGTTDGINIVANGLNLSDGSEIIITEMEHHSNILPWQLWCERNHGKLKVLPINDDGTLQINKLEQLINSNTRLISVAHVSNTLGVINSIDEIIKIAKFNNVPVLIDGAQAVPHMKVDMKQLGSDFFVFSGHKMYAPTGVGVLWMDKKWLPKLQLSKAGGGTIKTVSFEKTEYAEGALRFEPGTPNIEGVIGLAAAINYINSIGIEHISKHEHTLLKYATEKLNEMPEVEIYANHLDKAAVISFNVKGAHPFDVGTLLDKYGIAVRTGHHCTQPLMKHYNIPGTVRASLAMYNTLEEVNEFIEALQKSIKMLS